MQQAKPFLIMTAFFHTYVSQITPRTLHYLIHFFPIRLIRVLFQIELAFRSEFIPTAENFQMHFANRFLYNMQMRFLFFTKKKFNQIFTTHTHNQDILFYILGCKTFIRGGVIARFELN